MLGRWRRPYSAEGAAGAQMSSSYFAVLASATAAAAGHDANDHRRWYGELLAPFTAVAATRPDVAWFPEPRGATEISSPTDDNRFVAEPFTKLMCSFPTIDLAAAVIVTCVEVVDRLGIPESVRVYPWAAASATEDGPPSERAAMHRSEAYALGGFVDDFGVGLYSRADPARPFAYEDVLRPPASGVVIARTGDEVAEVIAGTVLHDRDTGPVEAPVIVRLADGSRLGARASDPSIAGAVAGTTLVGRRVRVRTEGDAAVWFLT